LSQQVVRRSGRIPKEIPIVLIGSDFTGKILSEPTNTVLLSLHGAGLASRNKLSPEQELVLRWPERNKEAEIRVVGQIGEDSGVYTYGVAFFDSVVNFWEMEFPPPTPQGQGLGVLTLICNVCKTLECVDDNSIKADIVATNDGVLRHCKRCVYHLESWPVRLAPSRFRRLWRAFRLSAAGFSGAAPARIVAARVVFGIWSSRSRAFSGRGAAWK